jgi:hypothetical protein
MIPSCPSCATFHRHFDMPERPMEATTYILECHKYNENRKKLGKEVEQRRMRLEKLLGCSELVKHTMEYAGSGNADINRTATAISRR